MLTAIPGPVRAIALGAAATSILVAAVSRPAGAEKALECYNQSTAVCQTIERCSGGFEWNGTCKWILTVTRSYWKY